MHHIKTYITLTVLLILGACTTPAPTYKNPAPLANDAEISFESDYVRHTHFSVNTDRAGVSCGKFKSVGYLLKADSVFIYDKPNTEIIVKVPTKKMIGVGGYHAYDDPGYKSSCYPKSLFFTPAPNEKYIVKMNRIIKGTNWKGDIKSVCYLSVKKVGSNGDKTAVKLDKPASCTKVK